MKHKLTLITAFAMFCLTACAGGPQLGTETDNTDIMVPDTVNTYSDAKHGLDFLFPGDWEQGEEEGRVTFTPIDADAASKVVVEYIESFTSTDEVDAYLHDLIGQGFLSVEGEALETLHTQETIDAGLDTFHRFIRKELVLVHLSGVLESHEDFPVAVRNAGPIIEANLCTGPCGQTYESADTSVTVYGSTTETLERVPPADEEEEVLQLDPSAMPQAPVPQYQLPGSTSDDDEESDDEENTTVSGAMLQAQPIEFSIP